MFLSKPSRSIRLHIRAVFALFVSVFALFAAPVRAHEYKAGDIILHHPWSRATPPGAKVAGGFMVLKNTGASEDRLIAGTFEASKIVEIHEMKMVNGVMQMRALEKGLPVPAGQSVTLKPGGYHVMFIDLKRPLTAGEKITGTLVFEKAGKVEVMFTIEAIGAGSSEHKMGEHETHAPAAGAPAGHAHPAPAPGAKP